MLGILQQLAPIFFYFLIGIWLRHKKLADRSHGEFLLRLALFVTLPLMIITTLPTIPLTAEKAFLPLANIIVNLLCMGVTLLLARGMQLPRVVTGSMLMNTMITNNAFMFPFILAMYGESGFADAVLYDFGNALMVATVTYMIALRYGGEAHGNNLAMAKRIFTSPLFIALALAVILSVSNTPLPPLLQAVATPVAQMTAPVILIALGIYFTLSLHQLRLVGLAIFIRMGLGLVFGVAVASLFGLEGQTFVVVALCSGAPIGFMALTFSAMAKLDVDLTTSAVSLSILIGMIYTPLLILFAG